MSHFRGGLIMKLSQPVTCSDENKIIDDVLLKLGKKLVIGTPLAAGKANHLLNAFYRRAKEDSTISLTIVSALTLEKPKGKSLLEKRFLGPLAERLFADYPDLDYELDRTNNRLAENVTIMDFYFPAGKFLNNPVAQQNYISSNYTHVARDMMDRGANLILQLISPGEIDGNKMYSLSCNPDISLDLQKLMRLREERDGTPFAVVGQVNPNLPFMYGDGVQEPENFHFILDNPDYYFRIFGPPKLSVPDRDHITGLYLSTLIKDEGELQIGIGALGDAVVNALIMRQKDNQKYQQALKEIGAFDKFGHLIGKIGETGVFDKGLFGASEMVVDGFLHLYKAGILKRVVYDDLPLQRLLNEGLIQHEVTAKTLELLLERKAVHMHLSEEDFNYLVKYGVFKQGLNYNNRSIETADGQSIAADFTKEQNKQQIIEQCLGTHLKKGAVIHGGFFLGPQDFYDALKAMPEQERKLLNMRSVLRINQLYGHEEIDCLQRKNARFVNTCMMVTLSGSVVSDGLDDGRVVSGVGGQYNFVTMAHALPDGRSLMNLRATREVGDKVESNIVWNYGHTTIPRHLRDIVVSEYGIANLRSKTDSEIIKELLNIADSRFQQSLMQQAKEAGKLEPDYQIPGEFTNNYPHIIEEKIQTFKQQGFFQRFPFGTDFTEEEQFVGRALKVLKNKKRSKKLMLKLILRALIPQPIPAEYKPYLERMGLWEVKSLEERLLRKLLVLEFKRFD
jgi:acyl-CoA hydrolase